MHLHGSISVGIRADGLSIVRNDDSVFVTSDCMSNTTVGVNHADGNEASDCSVRFDLRVDFKSSNWIGNEVDEAAIIAVEVEADRRAELSLDSDVRIARSFTL